MSDTSYKKVMVYCPYCGCLNTEEHLLMELHKEVVWFLECRGCGKEATLILYDLSEHTMTTDMNVRDVRGEPNTDGTRRTGTIRESNDENGKPEDKTDIVKASQLEVEVSEDESREATEA